MPLKLRKPVVTYRPKTPAQDFLEDPKKLVLGVTYPKYEDMVIDEPGLKLRKPLFIYRSIPNDLHQRVQIVHVGSVTHRFSWEISLPPNPQINRWLSREANWAQIKTIILGVKGQLPANTPSRARLELIPTPSAAEFYNHIFFHEMQHVVDHRWIAQTLFGPWSTWLDSLSQRNDPFIAKPVNFDWIAAGGKYAFGLDYFVKYYQSAIAQTGASYHKTKQGGHPQIQFKDVMRDPILGCDVARFTISQPVLLRVGPDFYEGRPHKLFRPETVYDFATGKVDSPLAENVVAEELSPPVLCQADIDKLEFPVEVGSDEEDSFSIFE